MKSFNLGFQKTELKKVSDLPKKEFPRIKSSYACINNLFGNGWREGSVLHISGYRGCGKTTFLLQIQEDYSKQFPVAFLTNEETQEQIQEKCERLNIKNVEIAYMNSLEDILEVIEKYKMVIVDSFQGIVSNLSEKDVAAKIISHAKQFGTCVGIVVHLTKSGMSKGVSEVAHMVDQTLMLKEGSSEYFCNEYKTVILTTDKNRNGKAGSLVLEMKNSGYDFVNNLHDELYDEIEKEAFKK